MRENDVIHINGIYTYPVTIAAWYAQRYHKPHIVALRNGLDPFMFNIRRLKKMLGFRTYVQSILQRATVIHATAEQEVQHARVMGIRNDFIIIPNGVDAPVATQMNLKHADDEWPALEGKRVVLFLSRLSPQKGLDMLIPAWSELSKKYPDTILVIAGPDYQGYRAVVEGLVRRYNLNDTVLFTGEVRDGRKWSLYKRAQLFVLPSFSENFGNVIAEALSAQLPVLTTTATPWHHLEKYNCGKCVEPNQMDVQLGLAQLLSCPVEQLKKMGENGARYLATLNTWQDSAREFLTVYHRIQSHQ